MLFILINIYLPNRFICGSNFCPKNLMSDFLIFIFVGHCTYWVRFTPVTEQNNKAPSLKYVQVIIRFNKDLLREIISRRENFRQIILVQL